MKPELMFINNEWVSSISKATRDITDPASGELLAKVPESNKDDMERAIQAARNAFDHGPWKNSLALDRSKLLLKVADGIRARSKEFAELETKNCGKPLAEAEFDVGDAANCFEFYAGLL